MRDDYPIYENIILENKALYFLKRYQITDYRSEVIPSHYHLMYELMWFEQGQGSFTFNSECYAITDRTLVFIPALVSHELQLEAGAEHKRYLLQFESELIDKLNVSAFSRHKERAWLCVPQPAHASRIAALFSWCADFQQNSGQHMLFQKSLGLLLEDIFSLNPGNPPCYPAEHADFLEQMLKLLQQMERENRYDLTTSAAAERCEVSKSWFSRCFKTHYGMTFKEYILLRKLKVAIGLLSSTEMKIAEISQMAGFTDGAYFALKFRLYVGCTPREFRSKVYNNPVLQVAQH